MSEYVKQTWASGDEITAEKLNHIENGIYDLDNTYVKTTWVTGDIITAARLNNIENGIYALHDDYEKTIWVNRDVVTAEKLNKIEDNIYLPMDSFMTTLYTDGTFIMNEPSSQRANNILLHGAVTNEYAAWDGNANNYVFANQSERPWNDVVSLVTKVKIGSVIQPTSLAYWFKGFQNCIDMDVTNLDTSYVNSMYEVFRNCRSITELDLSEFNTSNVTTMYNMFQDCRALANLNISSFNTANVTTMHGMFQVMQSITSIDVSSFNTGNVTDMDSMFYGCTNLTTIFASQQFVVDQVTSSSNMFYSSTNLVGGAGTQYSSSYVNKARAWLDGRDGIEGYFTKVDNKHTTLFTDGTLIINEPSSQREANITQHGAVTNEYPAWDGEEYDYNFHGALPLWYQKRANIKRVVVAQSMSPTTTERWLYNCSEMLTANLSLLNTANTTSMYRMFSGCSKIQVLDLSNFDTHNVINMGEMFDGCSALTTIFASQQFIVDQVTSANNMFRGCSNLVGGAGTTYSSSYQGKNRAKIDGGSSDPGYFTAA